MEMTKIKKSISALVQKYKFVFLIILIGIVLMMLPSANSEKKKDTMHQENIPIQSSTQDDLEHILSQIHGAGTVRVLLKELTGEEIIYQTNEDSVISETGSTIKVETVVVTDSERNETGLIRQINPPKYTGAIVICQGADDPAVKLAVADAVSKITGLGLDKIAVLKMK